MASAPSEKGLTPSREGAPIDDIVSILSGGEASDQCRGFKLAQHPRPLLTKQLQLSQFPFKGHG